MELDSRIDQLIDVLLRAKNQRQLQPHDPATLTWQTKSVYGALSVPQKALNYMLLR